MTFNGVVGTVFTVDSATKIHPATPAVAAGARDVVVTTDAGTATKAGGFTCS